MLGLDTMRLLDLPHTASKVTDAQHFLYNAASASTLTLTGTLPSVSFRCQVRLYTASGKTDCIGSVTVGAETLTFTQASKKVTSTALSALPTITTANLNCMIEIIAIDSAGNPVEDETVTTVKIRFEPTTKSFQNSDGEWQTSSAYAMIVDPTCGVDTTIRYLGTDYEVAQVEAFPWLSGEELYRILYFA
jgi:hypothetical protein